MQISKTSSLKCPKNASGKILASPVCSISNNGNAYTWKYKINRPSGSIEAHMEIRIDALKPKEVGPGQKKQQMSKVTAETAPENSDLILDKPLEKKIVDGNGRDIVMKYELRNSDLQFLGRGRPNPEIFYIRMLTMEQASQKFDHYQRDNLIIYYRLHDGENHVDELPLEIPLVIAYNDGTNKIIHRQIKCYSCKDYSGHRDDRLWCAVALDASGKPVKESPMKGFASVRRLLEHWTANANCKASEDGRNH